MSDFKEYEANGLYFAYPTNWALEEYDMETVDGSIQLGNDDGAFWLLKKYPGQSDPEEIIREALEVMQGEYEDMEFERIDKILFEKSVTGYEMTFFYLDLMNLASVLCFEQAETTYAVFWQTGNQLIIQPEEAAPTEKVLEAITYSLLKGKTDVGTESGR